jgi:glycine betaine/choline ABC-type transport system substrate-binding protein
MRNITRRHVIGGASAALALSALGRPSGVMAQDDKPKVTIGSHNYSEQFILAEMLGLILEDAGYPVDYEHNLAGTVILHEGLISGDLDIYVEYLGGGLNILGVEYNNLVEDGTPAEEAQDIVYEHVRNDYLENWDLHWLDPIGVNNTYAIAMRRADAEELGVTKISELEEHAADLHLAGSQEFIVRIDGLPGMEAAYGFEFGDASGMESGLMYSALDNGDVNVISAFSTDGRIPVLDFVLLEDDKAFFPPYHASPVVRGQLLEEVPEVEELLNQMGGLLDNTTMAELNFRVDDGGEEPRDVARDFLVEKDLITSDS